MDITKLAMLKTMVGGSGGGGGVLILHINITAVDSQTMTATFTADKTPTEILNAKCPTWCVITVAAGILEESEMSFGVPPAWGGGSSPCFGFGVDRTHNSDTGNNKVSYVVEGNRTTGSWKIDLSMFGG